VLFKGIMENKAENRSESRFQTETKDKKEEKKLSTKPQRMWCQRFFCHVSRAFRAFII
jgi:hypothetical protein